MKLNEFGEVKKNISLKKSNFNLNNNLMETVFGEKSVKDAISESSNELCKLSLSLIFCFNREDIIEKLADIQLQSKRIYKAFSISDEEIQEKANERLINKAIQMKSGEINGKS